MIVKDIESNDIIYVNNVTKDIGNKDNILNLKVTNERPNGYSFINIFANAIADNFNFNVSERKVLADLIKELYINNTITRNKFIAKESSLINKTGKSIELYLNTYFNNDIIYYNDDSEIFLCNRYNILKNNNINNIKYIIIKL